MGEYKISENRRLVWEKELELFDIFKSICDRYDLTYFAICGTLLGTVRHAGFIPWDDDMDVAMPRADYDRFIAIVQENHLINDPFFFQTNITDRDYVVGNVRIRNSLTTAITKRGFERGCRFNQGIWFSIFPYDNVPDDDNELETFRKKVYFFKTLLHNGCYEAFHDLKHIKSNLMTFLGRIVLLVFGKQKAFDYYTKLVTKYDGQNTQRFASVATSSFSSRKKVFYKRCYEKLEQVQFENRKVLIPSDYDSVLTALYSNWRIPQRIESTHGTTYFDSKRPYMYYLQNKSEINDSLLLD